MGMGLGFGKPSGCRNEVHNPQPSPLLIGNPDPRNYEIVDTHEFSNGLFLAIVKYPDAKNFEGKKILIYTNKRSFLNSLNQRSIDPHFCDTCSSPIARFRPSENGLRMALWFCGNYES